MRDSSDSRLSTGSHDGVRGLKESLQSRMGVPGSTRSAEGGGVQSGSEDSFVLAYTSGKDDANLDRSIQLFENTQRVTNQKSVRSGSL